MTLPAFAAEHRRLQDISAASAAVDRYSLPAPALGRKLAAHRCCCQSTGQTDGRTYGRAPDRYIDPAPGDKKVAQSHTRAWGAAADPGSLAISLQVT